MISTTDDFYYLINKQRSNINYYSVWRHWFDEECRIRHAVLVFVIQEVTNGLGKLKLALVDWLDQVGGVDATLQIW